MSKKILALLGVILVLLLIAISRQPSEFRVSRSARVAAPASVVFAQVNDLRKWEAWSPWAKMDPNAKSTYEGPSAGVGATMRWEGNSKVGAGSMKITESRPKAMIRFQLDFLKPFKATNTAEFDFRAQGRQTDVTWSMYGKNNFMSKAIGLVMDCDKMVGGSFEQGLASLNTAAQAAAKK